MKTLIIAIFLAMAATSAQAQGYNCRASRTASEVVICNNATLSHLDERLNRTYARSHASVGSQRAWIRRRDRCGVSVPCLHGIYLNRLYELRAE